jgi:nucleotide-binding universal stress UspA family protein
MRILCASQASAPCMKVSLGWARSVRTPSGTMVDFKRILVATDFGESSEQAVTAAVDLAERFGAALTLLHVYEVPEYVYFNDVPARIEGWVGPIRDAASRRLDDSLAKLRLRLPRATSLLAQGKPADEILRAIAEIHPDLVVMGTHGRQGLAHVFLGSVAEKVLRLSSAPVLTVRGDVTRSAA